MTHNSSRVVRLSEIMQLARDSCPVDPETSYPIAGVYGFGRGMLRRPTVRGSSIGANQLFRIHSGQFIYSRLKSFEGAFALVDEATDGCYVSSEFPSFDFAMDCTSPAYIGWYFKQKRVWTQLASKGRGLGARRERLRPERLLEHRIVLPPLAEQRRIVAQLDAIAERISRRRAEVETVEVALAATLRAAFAHVVADAPHLSLGDVAPIVRRPVEIDPNEIYPELGVRSFGRGLFSKPDLIGGELTWQKLFRIEVGDLVFSNIKAWEGAFAVAQPEHHGRVGSHRYLTCVADSGRCTPDFLWYYLQSPAGIEQVRAASPGSADRNRTLSQKGLEAVPIPMPSLDAQRWFDSLQAKAAAVRRGHAAVASELAHLLPAMLHREFG